MAEPTRYQSVVSPTSYDTAGFPFKATFNGTNQWMQHAALDMTSTDEVTLWASLLKESDAALGILYEISTAASALDISVNAPGGANNSSLRANTRVGGPVSDITVTGYPAPAKAGLIARFKVSTDTVNLSIAGVQVGSNGTDQGTGNYRNNPGWIGARTGTSLFFKGEIFELGIAGRVITDGQLQSLNARMTRSAKI
jgi:hypothetical protein